ncbi:MAG: serine/threonine protein kinase, partial [Anaerolineae bacterium]|nr:serine/threonine protein kinase [Anaerolineae bacterium]
MEDLIGKTLGNYQIVRLLGKGGMAAVYLGFQPSMNRNVAIKVMAQQFKGETAFIQRFKNEARVIAQLEHAHILPVYDFGEENGVLYIVMRYLSAGTLEDRISREGMAPAEVQEYLSQLAPALDYAHSRGVIHRDLKPANVMIDSQGSLFLTDFGIAKSLEDDQKLTATDSVVGTPTYMSPEQGLGEKIDSRSDIYSLGVILYEMLTGQVPFTADNPMAVMLKHINEVVPAPSSINPKLTPAIDRVVLKALAKNHDERYATCVELANALKEALSGKAPAATSETEQIAAAPGRPGSETMPSPVAVPGATTTAVAGQAAAVTSAGGAAAIPGAAIPGAVIAPPPAAPVTTTIPVSLNALSKWLYAHDRLAVWVQGILLSLSTLMILSRLTEGGLIEIAALALVPGLLLYSLLRAPTVGALSAMVLILLPLLVHSPALALIWFVLIVVAGSRLHSREMLLVLVTVAAATHPLGVIVPLLAPWWFRGRRTVLPVSLGVI